MAVPAPAKRLLDFLASKEAPHGYDTVYANRMRDMPRPLTTMTLDAVIADGPRRTRLFGSSACGRYQFMTATLQGLKTEMRLTGREIMTPAFQDTLGERLLERRGYTAFMLGGPLQMFGLGLAKEWASFPVLAPVRGQHKNVVRGQSYYLGDGQNKALVSADEVERVLRDLRAHLSAADSDDVVELIAAPRADTVPAPTIGQATASLPFWARWLAKKPAPTTVDRPGLKPNGSPELWDVQKALRDRAYYTKGTLDGLDGTFTQAAVAQARKDNGLGDGGIDDAFRDALPTMPRRPVSTERANATIGEAAKRVPELFGPAKWLATAGGALLTGGAADGTGLLDTIQSATGKVNDVAGSAQTAIATVSDMLHFVVEHRTWFLVAAGAFLLIKAGSYVLDAWIKVRQAFF